MDFNFIILKFIQILTLDNFADKIINFITPEKLILILIFLGVLLFIIGYISYYLSINFKEIKKSLIEIKNHQAAYLSKLYENKIYLLFIIPLIITIFLSISLPITYDETFTFVNFIDRGIIISASFYPAPNNHVLYSVISSFINLLDFKSIIPFRIISIFFFTLSLLMISQIILENSKQVKNYYYIIISVFPLTLVYIYQSSLARGYSLLFFLTLLNIYILKKILKKNDNTYLLSFAFFTSLAFYVNPSYFYCHFIYFLLILFFKINFFSFLIKSNLVIFLLTILFYFPIIIFQGYDFIFQNNLIEKISYLDFKFYTQNIITILENNVFGISIIYIIILLTLSLYYSFKFKKLKVYIILFSIIIITIFLPFMTKTIAPGRTLILVYMLTPILLVLPTSRILKKVNKKKILVVCFFIQIILTLNIYNKMPAEKYSLDAEHLSSKILIQNGKYYSCSNLFDPLFLYFAIKTEIKISKLDLSNDLICDADKIENYDWIIIDKKRDMTSLSPNFDSLLWNFYKK